MNLGRLVGKERIGYQWLAQKCAVLIMLTAIVILATGCGNSVTPPESGDTNLGGLSQNGVEDGASLQTEGVETGDDELPVGNDGALVQMPTEQELQDRPAEVDGANVLRSDAESKALEVAIEWGRNNESQNTGRPYDFSHLLLIGDHESASSPETVFTMGMYAEIKFADGNIEEVPSITERIISFLNESYPDGWWMFHVVYNAATTSGEEYNPIIIVKNGAFFEELSEDRLPR